MLYEVITVPEVLKSAESTTDQVITDNLIVTSSLGVGTDMTSGYNFGYVITSYSIHYTKLYDCTW